MVDTYFFTDLDDTLVQSKRKFTAGMSATKISRNINGEYIGFATSQQVKLLDRMSNNALIIPVTGRYTEQLMRCDWTWDSYQIASHGAIVLDANGDLDHDWFAHIKSEVKEAEVILNKFMSALTILIDSKEIKQCTVNKVNLRLIVDKGIPAYLDVKQKVGNEGIKFLSSRIEKMFAEMNLADDWRLHINDRNFAILPPYASKARAVRFVKEQLNVTQNDLTIGLGDSMSDLAFMNECHLWVTPSQGQINQLLQKQDHSGVE